METATIFTVGFKDFISYSILNPLESQLSASPWYLTVAMIVALALIIGGARTAILAFALIVGIGVVLGKKLSEKVSLRWIELGSGILFIVIGIIFILEALLF